MRTLVTVNRNVKYSTQVCVETDTVEEAKELALDLAHNYSFPDEFVWDVNEDSGVFVSYTELSNAEPVNVP